MRLIVFGPGHPFRGGIARTTTEMVAALDKRGHEIVFATPRRQYPGWLYHGGDDQDPEACPRLENAQSWLDPLNPLSWRASRNRALEAAADVWIMPYWTWAWAGLWKSLLGAPSRPPVVGVVHNPEDHGAHVMQRWAARAVLEQCEGLFTHAEVLGDILRSRYPRVPVAHHPLAIPEAGALPATADARRRLGLPVDGRVALFLGLIRPYKGVDLLVEAMASLPEDSPWRLVIAGEPWGKLDEDLRTQVARSAAADRVHLRFGWVPETEVSDLLGAADLVVLPYRSGSQSAVAPMVLAHGLPVLSTAVGGLSEVVRQGVNGLLVEAGSTEAIVRGLTGLDEDTLAELTDGARGSVAHLSWSAYAETLEELIDRVLTRR